MAKKRQRIISILLMAAMLIAATLVISKVFNLPGGVVSTYALSVEYDLYVERPASEAGNKYYTGAKYEPKTGAYIGMYAEGDSAMHDWKATADNWYFGGVPRVTGKDHAVYMVYVQYGSSDAISHYASHYKQAKEKGKAMQICLEPSTGLDEVQNDQHLIDLAKQANDAGIPIYLRFANEFNTTGNNWASDGPAKYIEKYRIVANAFHKYAPNAVMVWSPNDYPKENIDSFYPGDAYVDWIGVSCYPLFQADGTSKGNNTWIDRFYEIYEKYSSRKPFMISEGAPSTTLEYHPDGKKYSNQAAYEIQRFYAGAARKCPRLKLIIYWSMDSKSGRAIQCRLSNNETTLNAYKDAISDSYFISKFNTSSDIYYQKVSATTLKAGKEKISSYVNNGTRHINSAIYYINGNYAGGGYFPDYEDTIDFSSYAGKTITIKTDYYLETGKYLCSKTMQVKVSGTRQSNSNPVKLVINGKTVTPSVAPVIENGTTLVPVRTISESLSATVDWDQKTKTVTIVKDNKTIKLTINNKIAYINGTETALSAAPKIINGSTLVPLRFIAEAFNADVKWDNGTRTITITE